VKKADNTKTATIIITKTLIMMHQ